ncbi:primosomal protein N' [Zoogloea ramigera]|uniref:Replication restart protein PriA n=1 Tax=Zoogloea ramigera TaxID=350 RepID=A0A4Y4CUJ6_ZOORA|nr:primosomal protein N' [Zoogloea ramigera]GEC95772.1 primosomal protein N' [Zoogloea ramigera]
MSPAIVRVALPVPLPQCFDYTAESIAPGDLGRCVRVPFGRGEKTGLIVALPDAAELPVERLKPVIAIQREAPALPADWLALVEFTARYYQHPLGEVVAMALPPRLRRADAVAGAEADPLLELSAAGRQALADSKRESRALALLRSLDADGPSRRQLLRDHHGPAVSDALKRGWITPGSAADPAQMAGAPTLTDEQQAAVASLSEGFGCFQPFLLFGVTGSGKTEVYLRLVQQVIAGGGQALILVPEIALTPQLEGRVAGRFPAARVVSLHSALAEGARSQGFVQAMEGRADIVLGTRLSVFTPLPRLGLIVVDEEHDASYKQHEGVRYSARDLAIWRARQRSVPIVLGSATPSLESWHAAETGRYKRVELASRAVAATLPKVRPVDVRREKLQHGLSEHLLRAVEVRLQKGEQSLIFLNRRGYAPVLSCPSCGWVSRCPHCTANMVLHLADRRLRCHHCSFEAGIPLACPDCGDQDIQPFGRGTQRLEETLAERFPTARVLRVDRDAARTRSQWDALLEQIGNGEADILVGTQMMAKGHDFPKLTFVGVLNADSSLFAADFRAPERLFQQLMQVGGRAGRGQLPGEVMVQTQYPDHPLYQCLARHDFQRYAALQLDERKQARFPPFAANALLCATADEVGTALDWLKAARAEALPYAQAFGVMVFDPVPMRMVRLARRERAQLLVEAPARPALQAFLSAWSERLWALKPPRVLRWHLDVDPAEV